MSVIDLIISVARSLDWIRYLLGVLTAMVALVLTLQLVTIISVRSLRKRIASRTTTSGRY